MKREIEVRFVGSLEMICHVADIGQALDATAEAERAAAWGSFCRRTGLAPVWRVPFSARLC